jgi:HD-GYP domain-containing protein (c-di-GMP phosphodiesterase class II)
LPGPRHPRSIGTTAFKKRRESADNRAVKLVAFDPQQLRPGLPLPFGLRDAAGRLLLAPGQKIKDDDTLRELTDEPLYTTEAEAHEWRRRLAAAMDVKLREGASLKDVVAARPDMQREAARRAELSLPEAWEELAQKLDTLLRCFATTKDGLPRLIEIQQAARELGTRRSDGSLYYLIYQAAVYTERYASHHALLTLLIAESAARHLGVPEPELDSLCLAAVGMNIGMHKLQDLLAQSQLVPTPAMRSEIDAHGALGAQVLQAGGLVDPVALHIVRHHHTKAAAGETWAGLPVEDRLARLLNRVDIFTAKISRRATRQPMSPVRAAKEACLDPATGQPDPIGAAMLKTVGLYPPGSFVELVSGEFGIVVGLGRRANLPFVAALVAASGNPLAEPALRDTLDRRHAVKAPVPAERVRVRPPHEKLLALR